MVVGEMNPYFHDDALNMTNETCHYRTMPYVTEKLGAPRSAYLLVAESATGKVLTQRILYRVLGLRW